MVEGGLEELGEGREKDLELVLLGLRYWLDIQMEISA